VKIGFISDAHGHIGAFVAGLRLLEAQLCDEVFFLGDAIGYIPSPDVVRMVRKLGIRAVLGNHEAMALLPEPPRNDEVYQLERCRKLLSDSDMMEISCWPTHRFLSVKGRDVRLMHGSPTDLTYGYVYPESDLDQLPGVAGSVTVMGNTHRPFWRSNSRGALFLNVGSCGLPRDCGGLGSVATLDVVNQTVHILRFDITKTARQALAKCAPVHHSVIALFDRPQTTKLVGEICVL